MSSILINELPLDLSNLFHWKFKYLPGIIRVALSSKCNHSQLLCSLEKQYFSLPSKNFMNEVVPGKGKVTVYL